MATTSTRLSAPAVGYVRLVRVEEMLVDATNNVLLTPISLVGPEGSIPLSGGFSIYQGDDTYGWGMSTDLNVSVLSNGPNNSTGAGFTGEPFDRWTFALSIGPDAGTPSLRIVLSAVFQVFAQ